MLETDYWNDRYANGQIGWDLGIASAPITTYIDQLKDKSIKILIPGCGNGYEAEYLWRKGFKNIYVSDVSEIALNNFKSRVGNFPIAQILLGDYFDLNNQFDLIIEQTFFCALNPNLRQAYVIKMHQLLKTDGKLVGLLFNRQFEFDGPPFGGTEKEYVKLFENYFNIKILETAYNSVSPRHNNELFFIFEKKELNEPGPK